MAGGISGEWLKETFEAEHLANLSFDKLAEMINQRLVSKLRPILGPEDQYILEILDFNLQECRVCGCTDAVACEGGCYWIEKDLCSACWHEIVMGATAPFLREVEK